MPPALVSEGESSDSDNLETIPAKAPKTTTIASPDEQDEADDVDEEVADAGDGATEGEEDAEDEDEELYAVEKIIKHDFDPEGTVLYRVKWLGYEKEADQTWEPEANLTEGAKDILEAYHKKIGGRPTPPTKGTPASGKRGRAKRKLPAEAEDSPAPTSGKRGKKAKTESNGASSWTPPDGDWENHVQAVELVEERGPGTVVKGEKVAGLACYLKFNGGHHLSVAMGTVREKCPQRLLDFYEQHLSFKEAAK